jgi:hypothetical protein
MSNKKQAPSYRENHMSRFALLLSALLALPVTAAAQNWQQFKSIEDRFSVNFPGDPVLSETTFTAEDGNAIPARLWSARSGEEYYAVTVVDFEPHYEPHNTTVQGSMADAATEFRRRVPSMENITYDGAMRIDRIPGHTLQIRKPEGGFLYVLLVLHQDEELNAQRLYITEADVPPGVPPPGLFQQSFEVLDETGVDIRYSPDGLTRIE